MQSNNQNQSAPGPKFDHKEKRRTLIPPELFHRKCRSVYKIIPFFRKIQSESAFQSFTTAIKHFHLSLKLVH